MDDTKHEDALRDLVLRTVMLGTFSALGDDFFRLLVCALASALGVRYAFVTECREPVDGEPPGLIPICAWCKKVRDEAGAWDEPEAYLARRTRAQFTHGICPDCAKDFGPERLRLN